MFKMSKKDIAESARIKKKEEDALEALRIVTILASPAMPKTCQDVWRRLGMVGNVADQRVGADTQWGRYPGGTTVTKGEPLFPRKKI